jgi:hypothetical protein
MLQTLLLVPLLKAKCLGANRPQVPFSETVQSNQLPIDKDTGINASGNISFCSLLLDLNQRPAPPQSLPCDMRCHAC